MRTTRNNISVSPLRQFNNGCYTQGRLPALEAESNRKMIEKHQQEMIKHQAIQKQGSHCRSIGRMNKLLNQKPQKSQCSSATTAFTMLNFQNNPKSAILPQAVSQNLKMTTRQTKAPLVGKKRQNPTQVDFLEQETRPKKHSQATTTQDSRATPGTPGSVVNIKCSPSQPKQKLPYKVIKLLDKKSGQRHMYKLYKDQDLEFLRANCTGSKEILSFNMKKLELEYDYDTDEEQLNAAKRMLTKENIDAVEYFVKEDPLILVGNLE